MFASFFSAAMFGVNAAGRMRKGEGALPRETFGPGKIRFAVRSLPVPLCTPAARGQRGNFCLDFGSHLPFAPSACICARALAIVPGMPQICVRFSCDLARSPVAQASSRVRPRPDFLRQRSSGNSFAKAFRKQEHSFAPSCTRFMRSAAAA